MEKKNTKKIILEEALNLFATQGYDAVTVADIAQAVGIKAPSLYKHYKSKQDIFDSIIKEMEARYVAFSAKLGIEGNNPQIASEQYLNIDVDVLIKIGTEMFLYYLHDDYASKFRKMLTVEQFKNTMVSKLYVEQYIDSPLQFQQLIFEGFMKKSTMWPLNSKVAALHFYSPMFLLFGLCDNYPNREQEALNLINDHIIQFSKLYMRSDCKWL